MPKTAARTEPGWTKGPWRVFDKGGTLSIMAGPKMDEVVFWTGFDASHFQAQKRANARLIAAAPVMVTALQAAPDIHALTSDQFYAAYCNWNTLVRMAALADAGIAP